MLNDDVKKEEMNSPWASRKDHSHIEHLDFSQLRPYPIFMCSVIQRTNTCIGGRQQLQVIS